MNYVTVGGDTQKSKTLGQRLSVNPLVRFSNASIESTLQGGVDYVYQRNRLAQSVTETTDYNLQWAVSYTFPFNLSLHSLYNYIKRRGYNMAEMNSDENVWNLGVSYRFLREKRGRLRLEFYDVLHQRSNLRHEVGASGWSEQSYVRTNAYCLLSFSYRMAGLFHL